MVHQTSDEVKLSTDFCRTIDSERNSVISMSSTPAATGEQSISEKAVTDDSRIRISSNCQKERTVSLPARATTTRHCQKENDDPVTLLHCTKLRKEFDVNVNHTDAVTNLNPRRRSTEELYNTSGTETASKHIQNKRSIYIDDEVQRRPDVDTNSKLINVPKFELDDKIHIKQFETDQGDTKTLSTHEVNVFSKRNDFFSSDIYHGAVASNTGANGCCSDSTSTVVVLEPSIYSKNEDNEITSQVFLPHLTASCIAFWCCGCMFGAVAFILAVISSRHADRGNRKKSHRLSTISLVLSMIGVTTGFVGIILITLWYLGVIFS